MELTKENWPAETKQAISDLPYEVGASIGFRDVSDDLLILTIATEEQHIEAVKVQYFSTLREFGWPEEQDVLYQPNGVMAGNADKPVVGITSEFKSEGMFPGASTAEMFRATIQFACLKIMAQFGLVGINHDGKYCTLHGKQIMD